MSPRRRRAQPKPPAPMLAVISLAYDSGQPRGTPAVVGEFRDTPVGRASARRLMAECEERALALSSLYRRRVPPMCVVERVFEDGRQPLAHVPAGSDYQPATLAEAQAESEAFQRFLDDERASGRVRPLPLRLIDRKPSGFTYEGKTYPRRAPITLEELALRSTADLEVERRG